MRTTRSLLGGAMVLGLGVAVLPGVAGAAPPDYQQQDRITAPDGGGTMDYFGSAVALDDDTMVVGAPGNDAALVDSGAVYILERSTGTWSGFYYSEAEADLGASVAFDGDTMVVGAPRADGVGSALVVTRSEGRWQVQDKLTAPDGATNDDFGAAVAVSVDTAVVGAPGKGAAYVFTRLGDGWVLEDQVTTSLAADSQFGASVAVDGDIAVVGAPSLNRSGGTAYFFERSGSTWTETTTFGGGGELGDLVGASVALDGDTAMVGAPGEGDGGAAYALESSANGWAEQDRFIGLAGSAAFGSAVAVDGGLAVVGDPSAEHGAGGAYVLCLQQDCDWSMHGPLKGSDSRPNDAFAQSVDISGGTTVIGAPYELGESGMQAGAAYLFGEGDPAPPAENQAPVADDQQVSTPQDTAVAITLTGSDADGDELSYAVADDPAHGSLSGDAPDLTYTPADGYHGSDDFTFTVDDGNGGSDTGTVSITVTPAGSEPNQAPVAQDASIDATEGRPATVTIEASDADGDELSYAVGDAPGNGTVSGDGPEITYTSDSGFTGDDSFTVDVCDPSNACDTATVTIEVAPWDPPAQPPADAGQLTVNPSTVNAGDIVSVSGSGFEPYETVFLVLYSETTRLAAIPAGDDGTLAGTITIPDGTEPGEHQLVAYGEETALAAPLTVLGDMDDPKDDPKGSGSPRGGQEDDLKVKRFVDHAPEPGGRKLAMTGAAVVPLLGLGGALIALGGAWLLAARRARHR